MCRQRTRTSGLVSHATPNGKLAMSEENKLTIKFNKGTISKDELKKLAVFMSIRKKSPKMFTEVQIFGTWTSIKALNLDINILIQENFKLR